MNQNSSLVISIAVAVVLVIAIAIFFTSRKSSGKKPDVSAPMAPTKVSEPVVQVSAQQVEPPKVEVNQVSLSEIPGTVDSKQVPADVPESMEGRKLKLRERLGRSQGSLGQVFRQSFSG